MSATTGNDLAISHAEVRALREICTPSLRYVIALGESNIAEAKMAIFKAKGEIEQHERVIEATEDYLMKARIANAALERLS